MNSENLAAGSGSGFTATDGINAWNAEAKDYNPQDHIYSHFTQVVWKSTTQLGCALVTCGPGTIFSGSSNVRTLSPTFIYRPDLWMSYGALSSLFASTTQLAMLRANSRTFSISILQRARPHITFFLSAIMFNRETKGSEFCRVYMFLLCR